MDRQYAMSDNLEGRTGRRRNGYRPVQAASRVAADKTCVPQVARRRLPEAVA